MIAELKTGRNGDPVRGLPINALPTSANGWPLRPFQIVSLLEMLKFHAEMFTIVVQNLLSTQSLAERENGNIDDPERKDMFRLSFVHARTQCKELSLQLSAIYLDNCVEVFKKDISNEEVSTRIDIALDRITDEIGLRLFVHIPSHRSEYYADSPQFGDEVATRFAKSTEDIQEAGKCLALGRSTACVFHLMRVTEAAVQYLGKKFNVSLVGQKNWANILDEVDKAVKALPIKTSSQKRKRNRYAESSAHLRMVKDAWRNDVMHPKETYTDEEAERVFRNVKDFMVYLATKL